MRLKERRETGQFDILRSRLDQILDMNHALVKLAKQVDWVALEQHFGSVYSTGKGYPPLPTRLMVGLTLLKYTKDLSDEGVCAAYLENPYFQYFCGEEFFQHQLPLDRSSLTRWRKRMGEEKLQALLNESLIVGVKTQAIAPQDLQEIVVDTTVQEKAITFPTQAKLALKARQMLVKAAQNAGIQLRQSYAKLGKKALIAYQRYKHAKHHKRAKAPFKTLHTQLKAVIFDIARKIAGNETLQTTFKAPLELASCILEQRTQKRGQKVFAWHAPEVECIGKGKAHKPYEFGVKVSVATTVQRSKGGQFALHALAIPGNPHDGKTLAQVLPDIEKQTGVTLKRVLADRGYRGSNALDEHKWKLFIQEQKRGMTKKLKRLLNRRAAVEPVIGHIKNEHRGNRNLLKGKSGDAINAILAATGYNLSLLLKWLSKLFCCLWAYDIKAIFLTQKSKFN